MMAAAIMRTLTALTAVSLPHNLIAGSLVMSLEFIRFVRRADGYLWIMGSMMFITVALVMPFWRKRRLAGTSR